MCAAVNGHPLQSGIGAIQWSYGANHEGFAPLLRADGDPVGDGTAENLGHSISILGWVEIQPGALGILLQQALALQAAAYALADQVSQAFELVFIRCLDTLKAGRSIVAIHVDAIQEKDVEMYIEVEGSRDAVPSEALYQRHRTGGAILQLQSSLADQMGRNSPVNDTQYLAHRLRVGGEKVSQRERKTDDPLAQWYIGEYIIREMGRCLGHAAGANNNRAEMQP